MSDYKFTYRNDSFNLNDAPNAELFVKAGPSELSFLVTQNGSLMAWKDKCPAEELSENMALQQLLASPFKQVVVGITPDNLTLIPSAMFIPEQLADYARYLDVKPEDKVFAAPLDEENQVIYRTPQAVPDMLSKKFNLQQIVPADRGWITAIAKTHPDNHSLYLDVIDNQLSIVNFNGGKLRFYNTFKTADVNDTIYYCLFVAKRLDMQPDDTSLIISGQCPASDVDKLTEFFRMVKYSDMKPLNIPLGVPAHQLLSLAVLA